MMATSLEKELRLIRERLDSIEDALAEEMSEDDKKAHTEALKEHEEGKTIPFVRKGTTFNTINESRGDPGHEQASDHDPKER